MEMVGMVLVQEDEELHEHVIYYLGWNLVDVEIHYSHVDKLALASIHAVQCLRHYILLRQTLVVAHINPFQFVLSRRRIGGKYNKWIVILQEFDIEFVLAKSKKSLIFAEVIFDFPSLEEEEVYEDSFLDKHIFLISTVDPWYSDIIIYLQTLKVPTHLSQDEQWQLRHIAKNYLIMDETLYHRGVDSILRRCLTHDETEVMLDFHGGVCGGHLSGLSTA